VCAPRRAADGGGVRVRGRLHAPAGSAPHGEVDIRSASGRLFLIVEDGTGTLLGTVDEPRAFLQVHPGAIYLHQGEQYEVVELDLARSVALVRPSDADWYTQSRDITDIEVLRTLTESKLGETPMFFGDVRVTDQVVGFVRKLHMTGEILETVPLDLPPQESAALAGALGHDHAAFAAENGVCDAYQANVRRR
jgi:ATP-dependent helicase YprA (DUF1998 family)